VFVSVRKAVLAVMVTLNLSFSFVLRASLIDSSMQLLARQQMSVCVCVCMCVCVCLCVCVRVCVCARVTCMQ